MSKNNEKNITMIPIKYIKGGSKLESDKLLILSILLQGITPKNTTIFNIRYLCKRLDTDTGNTNRTSFLLDTLEYFENSNILFFSDECTCKNKISIKEFTSNNKMDVSFGEFYDVVNKDECISFSDVDMENIFQYCKVNKLSKYLMFHLYLFLLHLLSENINDKYISISINEIKSQLNINKETALKYMEGFDDMDIFYSKSTGISSRNGYRNVIIYCCKPVCREYLDNKINTFVLDTNIEIISKRSKKDINIVNNYTIHYDNLENIELRGLYLIRNLDNNMLKIGVSNNLKSRINEIRSGFKFCGIEPHLKIECFIETIHYYKLENFLHKEFAENNHQNEWFNITNINTVLEKVKEYIN